MSHSSILEVEADGDLRIIRWRDGENRFRRDSIDRWHGVLDELEAIEGPLAVVITGEGKFFSNGLDLDWMADNSDDAVPVVDDVHRLFGRMLLFPAYTVAAINGHAFAAGAMLTCAVDRRVMRSDRGYWCLPEVDIGLALTDGMAAVVATHMPPASLADAMITARRYDAEQAKAAAIVEHHAPTDDLEGLALELAQPMVSKDRGIIATHKRMLFGAAAARCGWAPEG